MKRILASAYLLCSLALTGAAADISGRITAANAPVEGVLVSDGFTFAKTDAEGRYTIAANADATTVFVVVPSGYEIDPAKVTNGRVQHFYRIDPATAKTDADFALKSIGDDTRFHFLVHTDTQPNTDVSPYCWEGMHEGYPDMQKTADALRTADGFNPFLLHLGDITLRPSDHWQYESFLDQIKFKTPLFFITGNHDKLYYSETYNAGMESFLRFAPAWYSFNRGKIHFLMLDNIELYSRAAQPEGSVEYYFGYQPAMLEWVKRDLEHVEKGSQIVVCIHMQMTSTKSRVKASKPLLDLLADYNVLLLTGHLHKHNNDYAIVSPNIRERNQTALGGDQWRGPCAVDGSPKGYYIYTANGSEISWKFKPTGKDPDKFMFKIYEPGNLDIPEAKAEEDKEITVNVWDWDRNWTLSYSVDGKEMGAPEQFTGKDPLAEYNYAGRKEGYEVYETYHLFRCRVPRTGGEMTFKATDPFGRSYSKSITLPHVADGIEATAADTSEVTATAWFTPAGAAVAAPTAPGLYLLRETLADGITRTRKIQK